MHRGPSPAPTTTLLAEPERHIFTTIAALPQRRYLADRFRLLVSGSHSSSLPLTHCATGHHHIGYHTLEKTSWLVQKASPYGLVGYLRVYALQGNYPLPSRPK